jgi:hypothetical protein
MVRVAAFGRTKILAVGSSIEGRDFRPSLGEIMSGQAKKKPGQSEPVKQKRSCLTVQVLWGCHAFNASPEEAARQVVADLYEQLSRGGTVTVHIEGADGKEHTLDVSVG